MSLSRTARERLSVLFVTPFLPSPPQVRRPATAARAHLGRGRVERCVGAVLRRIRARTRRRYPRDGGVLPTCGHRLEPRLPRRSGTQEVAAAGLAGVAAPATSGAGTTMRRSGRRSSRCWRTGTTSCTSSWPPWRATPPPAARRTGRVRSCASTSTTSNTTSCGGRPVSRPGRCAAPTARSSGARCGREERHAWAHLDGCTLTSARDEEMLLAEAPTRTRRSCRTGSISTSSARPTSVSGPRGGDAALLRRHRLLPEHRRRCSSSCARCCPGSSRGSRGVRLCIVGRKPPEIILAQRSARRSRSPARSTTSARGSSARPWSSSRCASAGERASRSSRRWRWARPSSRRRSARRGSTSCRGANL